MLTVGLFMQFFCFFLFYSLGHSSDAISLLAKEQLRMTNNHFEKKIPQQGICNQQTILHNMYIGTEKPICFSVVFLHTFQEH